MTHASESQHWYDRGGLPAYEVKGANGNMRPATLRDARKLGLVPSVTTIIKCAAAPALETWKVKQGILAALTLTRNAGESDDAYLARVMADSKEQAKDAAALGTEIHAAIQGHYEGVAPPLMMWPYVKGVADSLSIEFGERDWITEKSFAHPDGFGGKVDLHGQGILLDFKGKDFGEDDKLETYDEHHMQLAAYSVGVMETITDCAIVYFSRNNPGLCRIVRIEREKLHRGWAMFCSLLAYWKAKNGYSPEHWKEAA